MSMPFGENSDIDNVGGGTGSSDGINPAWNEILQAIPEDAREQVIPHLKSWDTGVQNKIQSVHSEYAPYKFLKDENIQDEDVRIALGVVRAIQEDPQSVYNSLQESYGFGTKADQGAAGQNPDTSQQIDLSQLPQEVRDKLAHLEGGYNTMAEIMLQERNDREAAETAAKADAELNQTLAQLKTAHGNFDEGYVLAYMHQGMPGEQAVAAYNAMIEQKLIERSRPEAPKLLGSGGGGFPGNGKIDPTKLDAGQTKNLVAQYLAAQAANNK